MVYRVVQEHYQACIHAWLLSEHTRKQMNNVETRIIRHDPPSFAFYVYVMLITMRARNFCLKTRSKVGKLVADIFHRNIRITITDSNRRLSNVEAFFLDVFIAGSSVSSTLDTCANGCVGRRIDRYGGAISPGSGEPNHLRARKNRRWFAADSSALSRFI